MARSRLGRAGLVFTILSAAGLGASPPQPIAAATALATSSLSIWQVTPTPNPVAPPPAASDVSLSDVSAASTSDAWAVGTIGLLSGKPLAEHWNGTRWRAVATAPLSSGAEASLNGVDDLSSTDAWAVGQMQTSPSGQTLTLIEHWNGTTWSVVPSPNPEVGTSASDQLQAIGGVGPNDLWAVGSFSDGIRFIGILFEHWNGTSWRFVPPPDTAGFKFGKAVTAIASNDAWAVGNFADGQATLAEHWNGTAWSVVPTPNLMDGSASQNFLTGVIQAGSNDVWASGYEGNVNQQNFNKPYMLHWNGAAWHLITVPNAGTEGSLLLGTTALSSSNIWAVGQAQASDGAIFSLTEHFNGTEWRIVSSPTPGDVGPLPDSTLDGTAGIAGGPIWAVGSQSIPGQCCVRTLGMEIPSGPATSPSETTGSTLATAALAWGDNSAGELGDGSATQSLVPVSVSGLSGIKAVSAGGRHGLALLSNGTVMTWGDNTFGQLGDGFPGVNHSSTFPVAVKGLSGVVAISSGGEHSLALLSNGTVMAWGDNADGQLGNGTKTNSDVPVAVKGLSGVVAISAGYLHSLAVLSNGAVMAWGDNADGQLGNGSTSLISDVPVVVKNLSNVAKVAAGGYHSLALLKNGKVMAWGSNIDGQLGDGTINLGSDVPVTVKNLSGAVAIAAGSEHSVALLSNGTIQAWGSNSFNQLGQRNGFPGGIDQSDVPVAVPGLSGVKAVAAGGLFTLSLLTNGTVMDWGDNAIGQLGNGTTNEVVSPTAVPGLSGVIAISAGNVYSLAAS